MAKGKEVATVDQGKGGLAVVDAAFAAEIEASSGAGLEGIGKDDMSLPFLSILQSLSPQVNKRNEKFIEGAEPGKLFNTVTNEVYDGEDGVRVIPCHFAKVYNEWVPRKDGGGFRGSHRTAEEAEANKQPDTEIMDTAVHAVLVEGANGWDMAVLSLKKSGMKASRAWNSQMKLLRVELPNGKKVTPPSYATVYRLTTAEASNDKGTFFVPKLTYEGLVTDPETFAAGKAFYAAASSGAAKIDHSKESGEAEEQVYKGPNF